MLTPTLLLCLLPVPQDVPPQPAPPARMESATQRWLARVGEEFATIQGNPARELLLVPQDGRAVARPSGAGAWLGVRIDSDDDEGPGLSIQDVIDGSPAARAGVQEGDRILSLGDARLEDFEQLRQRLAGMAPGQEARLTLRRELRVPLDERGWGGQQGPRLGVSLSERDGDGGLALLVTQVQGGWPAEAAGIRVGDRLVSVDGDPIDSYERLQDELAEVEPGHELDLGIERRVQVTLGSSPDAQANGGRPQGLFVVPDTLPRTDVPPIQPRGGWRVVPAPLAPHAEATPRDPDEGQTLAEVQEQMRALTRELRALREELSDLRRQLQDLRRDR